MYVILLKGYVALYAHSVRRHCRKGARVCTFYRNNLSEEELVLMLFDFFPVSNTYSALRALWICRDICLANIKRVLRCNCAAGLKRDYAKVGFITAFYAVGANKRVKQVVKAWLAYGGVAFVGARMFGARIFGA